LSAPNGIKAGDCEDGSLEPTISMQWLLVMARCSAKKRGFPVEIDLGFSLCFETVPYRRAGLHPP